MLDCFPEKCSDAVQSISVMYCLTLGRTDHASKMSAPCSCCFVNNLGELLGCIYMDDALIFGAGVGAVILLLSFLSDKIEYVS